MPSWSLPLCREPELMDDPALPAADHVAALGALGRINAISRTAAHLARGIRALRPAPVAPLAVVDVACGGGDVTIALARRIERFASTAASRAAPGPQPTVVGIDVSPRAIARAEKLAAARSATARFETRDVLRDGCPPCDVAVTSLFLHHVDDATAAKLLRDMAAAARLGVVVSDLIRSRLGLALAVIGTAVLSSSRVARVDGPASVRAARTIPEYHALLTAAGLPGATIRRIWPERTLVIWRKPAATAAGRQS